MKKYLVLILVFFTLSSYAEVDYFTLKMPENNKVKISRSELEKLPEHTITTSTNYTDRDVFVGVKISDFLKQYAIEGTDIRAFAWDAYSFTLPVNEAVKYSAIIAYKRGGKYMSVSELGPFAIIYPRDDIEATEWLSIDAKTIWQVKALEVR